MALQVSRDILTLYVPCVILQCPTYNFLAARLALHDCTKLCNTVYYAVAPDDERLDSFETRRAETVE